jgi:hypothetical protein
MGIENSLERIAEALENLVALNVAKAATQDEGRCTCEAIELVINEQVTEAPVVTETKPATESRKHRKKGPEAPEAPAAEELPTVPRADLNDITIEEMRGMLQKLSEDVGKDIAIAIIKDVGLAAKLSGVDTRLYPKMKDAVIRAYGAKG